VKLSVDIQRQMGTMNTMKPDIEEINPKAGIRFTKSTESGSGINNINSSITTEVGVSRWLMVGLVAVMVAGAAVATIGSKVSAAGREAYDNTGRMPEVVAVGQMPRLVTDTVYVSAVRNVAATPSRSDVN
jgi:hypothetical protein